MQWTRVIPCLLLKGNGFYKTIKFKKPSYLGDPVNILKIFNEKEVDEICILDIDASVKGKEPNFSLLKDLASECFMPLSYGGGIKNIPQMEKLFYSGFEKIVVNTSAFETPQLISEAAEIFGSQSVVVSMDVKKTFFGNHEVVVRCGKKRTKLDPVSYAKDAETKGAGEILLNAINRDGTMAGYDLELINKVSNAVNIPIVACGGAGNVNDFRLAVKENGASAVAAGAMFVYHGPHRAVLINVPRPEIVHVALD